jgi:hypothetical protein
MFTVKEEGGDFLLPRTWRFSPNSIRQVFTIIKPAFITLRLFHKK